MANQDKQFGTYKMDLQVEVEQYNYNIAKLMINAKDKITHYLIRAIYRLA